MLGGVNLHSVSMVWYKIYTPLRIKTPEKYIEPREGVSFRNWEIFTHIGRGSVNI